MVTVYSADWCPPCHVVKHYFNSIGVEYEVKDVEHDISAAQEAVGKSGQMGIPVIDINGTIVVGYNRPMIDSALKEHGLK